MSKLLTTISEIIYKLFTCRSPQKRKQVGHKKCGCCGNENLLKFRTLSYKICTDCGRQIYWPLEKGQKPLQ